MSRFGIFDFYNEDFDINNDLISLPRNILDKDLPSVLQNKYKLPQNAHILFSQIQQELLKEARRYAKRQKTGNGEYTLQENQEWTDKNDYLNLLAIDCDIPNVEFAKNNYALTGSSSFTLVPSTKSCVSDVLFKDGFSKSENFEFHYRQRLHLTFLCPESSNVMVELCDLRKNQYQRRVKEITFHCDPRVSLLIPPGVAYRIIGDEYYAIRCESDLFVDEDEPRDDIPLIGRDVTLLSEREVLRYSLKRLPKYQCPESVLQLLAQKEIENYFGI